MQLSTALYARLAEIWKEIKTIIGTKDKLNAAAVADLHERQSA